MKLTHTLAIAAAALALASCAGNSQKVGIVAHRGFWKCEQAENAQNTIAALKAAQDAGFWGSEFDTQLTLDGHVIVNHDDDIQGMLIKEHTLDTLKTLVLANGEHPSTLDEYLTQGEKGNTVLVFELKDQKDSLRNVILTDKSIAALKAHKLYDPSKVIFISFSHQICRYLAKIAPEFVNQYLKGDKSPAELHADGINGIDYSQKTLKKHAEYIGDAHKLGMSTNVYTVNKDSTMAYFVEQGVQFITTNEPLILRGVLGDKELKVGK